MLKLTTKLIAQIVYKNQLVKRSLFVSATQSHGIAHLLDASDVRSDEEWLHAKDYNSIPGPSRLELIADYLPGGELHNSTLLDLYRVCRGRYGDIFLMKGLFGKIDSVFTFNAKDFETVYRTEGPWPIRVGLESFEYYRKEKRSETFQGVSGLVSDQGQNWADVRNKVNPILMKVQNVRQNLPIVDRVSNEFIDRLESIRDPQTNLLTSDFQMELQNWGFEAIASIALNCRMGLLTDNPDPNARKLAQNMYDFFQYSYEYDLLPSFWKYYETSGFKRLLRVYDNITEITSNYIEHAIKKFEAEQNEEAKSVLEKLCRLDKKIAFVMAMDMLMAGTDTTTSVFISTLYFISKNPEKQEKLRKEIFTLLPEKNTPFTEENTKNMPYLRACIKEALRKVPITPGNFRVNPKDLVLSGYKVPKGTGILMGVMDLSNSEEYFPHSDEFLPERWLKNGPDACPAAKSTNPFVYLPFGFGPRTCIGKRIAEMEIETLISKLIRNYRITWEDKEDLKYKSTIILVPHGNINFKFEPL